MTSIPILIGFGVPFFITTVGAWMLGGMIDMPIRGRCVVLFVVLLWWAGLGVTMWRNF